MILLISYQITELKFKVDWIKENLKGVNRDIGFYALLNGQRFKRAIKDSLELFYKDLEETNRRFQKYQNIASLFTLS
mgnify:CR=1 FL=1